MKNRPLRVRFAEWVMHKLDFYIMDWYYMNRGDAHMYTNWDDNVHEEDDTELADAEWDAYWQELDEKLEYLREMDRRKERRREFRDKESVRKGRRASDRHA